MGKRSQVEWSFEVMQRSEVVVRPDASMSLSLRLSVASVAGV